MSACMVVVRFPMWGFHCYLCLVRLHLEPTVYPINRHFGNEKKRTAFAFTARVYTMLCKNQRLCGAAILNIVPASATYGLLHDVFAYRQSRLTESTADNYVGLHHIH